MNDRRDDPGFLFKGSPGHPPHWEGGMEIVEFLRARLDEVEEDAKAAQTKHRWADGSESFDEDAGGNIIGDGRPSVNDGDELFAKPIVVVHEDWTYPPHGYEIVEHIARHDPARMLRDVKAKRRIVDLYAEHADYDTEDWPDEGATGRIHGLGEAVRLLAAIDSDHPDYDEKWRP